MISTKNDIKKVLRNLNRVKSIPDYFRKNKIKGSQCSGCHCPVANFLFKKLGHTASLTSNLCVLFISGTFHEIKVPNNIKKFISSFDSGNFPDLILH